MAVVSDSRPPAYAGAGDPGALRSAARNGALGGVGALVASAAGFGFALLAGRALGTAGTGVLFTCVALAMLLTTLAALGADTGLLWALSRVRALDAGRGSRALVLLAVGPVTVASTLAAAALWWLAPEVATVVVGDADPTATGMVRLAAVAVCAGPLVLCLLQGSRGLGSVVPFTAVQQVAVPVTRLLALGGVVLLLPATTGTAAVAAWVAPVLLALPVALLVTYRRLAVVRRGLPASRPRPVRRAAPGAVAFWRYSLLRGLGTTAATALTWVDVVVVAALVSPAEAGAYAAASRFATSGLLGLQAIRLGIAPGVARAFARGDTRTVADLYNLGTRCATLLSWPVFWVLLVFAAPALGWFGPGFDSARVALGVLAVAMMLNVAAGNVATLLLMSGRSGWATRNTAAALVVTLGLDVLLVPTLGATGAAIGWLAGVVTENGLGLWQVTRHLGVRPDARTLGLVAGGVSVGCALATGGARLLLGPTTPGLLLAAVSSVAVALLVGWLLRERLQLALVLGRRGPGPSRPDHQESP